MREALARSWPYLLARAVPARVSRAPKMDADALEASTLMGRYCDGDAAAFHRIYALLAPRVLAYLTGLLGDRAAAEDVLQQTFLKVHEARSTFVRGANPIPWVYTIAHRTCLDEIRRRRRSRLRLTNDGELGTAPAADLTGAPEGSSEVNGDGSPQNDAAAAFAALEALPDNQRQALILTKVHGRTVGEAAMITGTTPGAIKQRAHRAYVTLREVLGRNRRERAARAPVAKELR